MIQKGFISELALNRFVIFVLALVSFTLSYNQLVEPDLSVGIFAQNGVYAYFSAAFVPVLFGIFLKNVPTVGCSCRFAYSCYCSF
jgi:sodium/pantothenate symporter